MGFPFLSRAKRKKQCLPVLRAHSDVMWTSLIALKESADAFPPLKSAVSAVIALCDVAEVCPFPTTDVYAPTDHTIGQALQAFES
jgi:hypothetical protein